MDCIDNFWYNNEPGYSIEFIVNMIALIPTMIENNKDPRRAFSIISRTVEDDRSFHIHFYDYVLVAMSQIMHIIPAIYFPEIFRVLKVGFFLSFHSTPINIIFET